MDEQVKVSTTIRDSSGEIEAQLERNEWKVSPFPTTWDRNYNDDSLEVIDTQHHPPRVVLQVRVLPDRIRLQGEWWDKNRGIRIVKNPQGGGLIMHLWAEHDPDEPHIEPIFKYPSDQHLRELMHPPGFTTEHVMMVAIMIYLWHLDIWRAAAFIAHVYTGSFGCPSLHSAVMRVLTLGGRDPTCEVAAARSRQAHGSAEDQAYGSCIGSPALRSRHVRGTPLPSRRSSVRALALPLGCLLHARD
jgi:hypothetical protein